MILEIKWNQIYTESSICFFKFPLLVRDFPCLIKSNNWVCRRVIDVNLHPLKVQSRKSHKQEVIVSFWYVHFFFFLFSNPISVSAPFDLILCKHNSKFSSIEIALFLNSSNLGLPFKWTATSSIPQSRKCFRVWTLESF